MGSAFGQKGVIMDDTELEHFWKDRITELKKIIGLLKSDPDYLASVSAAARGILSSFQSGGKLMVCGNGGSAADSQHIVTEMVSKFYLEREALNAEALTVNTSTLTAVANDYSFDAVFSRQIEAKGLPNDVLMAISTSGNSANIINAVDAAKNKQIKTIGMTGKNKESQLYQAADICICIPSGITPRIQEAHILTGHMICEFIEREMFQ